VDFRAARWRTKRTIRTVSGVEARDDTSRKESAGSCDWELEVREVKDDTG
jgi:hypothetical protein